MKSSPFLELIRTETEGLRFRPRFAVENALQPAAPEGDGFRQLLLGPSDQIYLGDRTAKAFRFDLFEADGSVNLRSGASDVGAGQTLTMQQIAAETLGVPLERVNAIIAENVGQVGGALADVHAAIAQDGAELLTLQIEPNAKGAKAIAQAFLGALEQTLAD